MARTIDGNGTVTLTIQVPQDVAAYMGNLDIEGCNTIEDVAERFVEDGALALRSLDEWSESEAPAFLGY